MAEIFKLFLLGQRSLNEHLAVLSAVFILVGVYFILGLWLAAFLLYLFTRIRDKTVIIARLFGHIR
jgi:hypothetical protein